MSCEHHAHHEHEHVHSANCGHTKIQHGNHVDYIHDGHLHHQHDEHWDECKIEVSDVNPDDCHVVETTCMHNEDCGHEQVPHGDHIDYLVDGRLQHVHGDHIDDHGPVEVVE
ncbi:hypothetical protein IU402_00520 [Aerococcaceae bacterium zg-BR9]|uniref:hypothetical protein n=1 Tax=Aerococcaceae bacterium zg-1292 TaxID=2774330 RepID=UPI004062DC35|nr:hypothetical protein [Aerococcaceae bacterium zg-BR9]MBF6978183.1 hypothetical protein [Aerococcaceae bacterium zg-BR22]